MGSFIVTTTLDTTGFEANNQNGWRMKGNNEPDLYSLSLGSDFMECRLKVKRTDMDYQKSTVSKGILRNIATSCTQKTPK